MNILHLMVSGGIGGIEKLMYDYALKSVHKNFFVFIWAAGEIADAMKNSGCNVIYLNESKNSPIKNFRRILKICDENKIDVIVEHFSAPAVILYMHALKKLRPSLRIYKYAHSDATNMAQVDDLKRNFIYKLIIRYSLNSCDGVIAISNSVKKSLCEYFQINDNKILVVYNGVDISKFHKSDSNKIGKTKLIYIGRLIPEKGVQVIIEAMTYLPDYYNLLIVGDGYYKAKLEQQAKMTYKDIEFLGARGDIPELLQKADIFVHMPLWKEGFGITVIEAMAAGKVCIVADSGAMREIVEDGVSGYIIDNKPASLAQKILDIKNPESLGEKAIQRAKFFSIEKFADILDKQFAVCWRKEEDKVYGE